MLLPAFIASLILLVLGLLFGCALVLGRRADNYLEENDRG